MMKNSAFFPVIFLVLMIPSVMYGINFSSLDIHSGLVYQFDVPAEDESTGAPDPLLTPLGVGTTFILQDNISFDPALFIYGMNYGFQTWDRPRPAQIEQREMYVISLLIDPAFAFTYNLTPVIDWGFLLSPAMIFRIPLFPAEGEDPAYGEMMNYFIGHGRFLYPGAGLFLNVDVNNLVSFRPALRCYLPVFHLWDGDPFLDQLTLMLDLGFRFNLSNGNS